MITSEENLLLLLVVSAPFFGSFISTLLIRLERKKSILKPIFSTCRNCDQRLLLKHKLPILSYIILKGACYRCKTPISSIYIMLETGFFISTSLAILILFNRYYSLFFQLGYFYPYLFSISNNNAYLIQLLYHQHVLDSCKDTSCLT